MEKQDWFENLLSENGMEMTTKQIAIHKAAIELFSEKGFAATSTKDIAQKASVAEGTIFKLYKTKYELMLGISKLLIDSGLTPLFGRASFSDIVVPNLSLREFLFNIYKNIIIQLRDMLPAFKLFLQEIPYHEETKASLIKRLPTEELKKCFLAFQSKGEIRPDLTAEQMLEIFLCGTLGFFTIHYIMKPDFFTPKPMDKDYDIDYYIDYICRGLK